MRERAVTRAGRQIPVIDLSCSAESVANQIGQACEQFGFFQIVGHGVPRAVIERAWVATTSFFEQAVEYRDEVRMPYPGYPYGYQALGAETLASSMGDRTPPDRKQTFSFGPISVGDSIPLDPDEAWVRSPNLWPTEPTTFRADLETYSAHAAGLAARMLELMALALRLPIGYFRPMIDQHVSAARCLDYPAFDNPAFDNPALDNPALDNTPLPGQLRAGAHTDYGTLTILRTAPGISGLEAKLSDGDWIPVDAVADGFVVNIGDTLAQWTNDRWRSTVHRVVELPKSPRRTSIAFFHNANWDAVIECIPGLGPAKYAPVRAGRHLMDKFHRTVT